MSGLSPIVEELASAKINLSLRVLGRRPDKYHELESLVVFASCGDRLFAESADDISLAVSGPYGAMIGAEEDNLVLRAAHALRARLDIKSGAHLRLEKNLPVASGIGGGSADAAACLRALLRLWKAELPPEQFAALALDLGADVPVCLDQKPVMMRGIGERLEKLADVPEFSLMLVNSGIGVSTAKVFQTLAASPLGEVTAMTPDVACLDSFIAWLEAHPNDLEAPAVELAPEIMHVLKRIGASQGCRLSRMSGSGATCFGVFAENGDAEVAAEMLRQEYPSWWVAVSRCG